MRRQLRRASCKGWNLVTLVKARLQWLAIAYRCVESHFQIYFADIAAAYRQELKELHAAGCRNVQIDDPNLAYFCSEKMLAGMKEEGVDADRLLQLYVNVYNDCLRGKPADMCAGVCVP